ncbi:hypothetical protein KAT36_04405 [Candidatus Pacearchaeota archaeon]|nr:hypothetical protein [Candidatus Pacearchaeota archaeon]
MIFSKKKKEMINLRELQKRGVVRIPRKEINIPTNNDGFIEFNKPSKSQIPNSESPSSNSDFFGFTNTEPTTNNEQPTTSFSDSPDGYNKREVDEKVTELDNKIYKLENRIELLEKKLDVSRSSDTSVGVMGW